MGPRAIFLTALVFLSSIAPVPCWANLGDTLEQSISRYGQPVNKGKGDSTTGGCPWYSFKKGNCEIEELFESKNVIIETYWKENHASMTQAEVEQILRDEAAGVKWSEPKSTSSSISWERIGASAWFSSRLNEMSLSARQLNH
jgi:hypothetical protein